MRSRPRTRVVAGLALAGALALSGCSVHPGAAAVVNGSAITQSRLDNLVLAACEFTGAQSAGAPSTSTAYLRTALLQDLISIQIAHKAVTLLHLTVSPAKVAEATKGETIPPGISGSDRTILEDFFTSSARSQIEQAVIGAHLKDPSVTDASKVTPNDIKAAQAWLTKFTLRQQIDVNPAYGSWNGKTVVAGDGSVSAAASATAKRWISLRQHNASSVTGLPASQVCG